MAKPNPKFFLKGYAIYQTVNNFIFSDEFKIRRVIINTIWIY